MDFRILGPLEVLDEGREVALGGASQRALLAVLLLHANETLSTDRLIDELWGSAPPADRRQDACRCTSRGCARRSRPTGGRAADRHARARLPAGSSTPSSSTPTASSGSSPRRAASWPAQPRRAAASARGGAAPCGAAGPRRPRLRAVRPERDRAPRRPAGRRARAARSRRELALGGHAEVVGRARGAHRRAPVPRAPARPAHARPLPLRPPGRGAAGLPGRPPRARRGAGHRAGRAAARARARGAGAGSRARAAVVQPDRPPPPPAAPAPGHRAGS